MQTFRSEHFMSLAVGAKFPVDIPVQGRRGPVKLSEMTASGPLIVAFHRLWCPFCQQAARDLTAVKGQLDAVGVGVVIVYREDAETACDSCAQRGIPFECLSDPDRELEQATEVKQFAIARYAAFSPTKLVSALRSGSRPGRAKSGLLQGRGTFVVDSDARIVYAHQSRTAADIPPIGDVLTAAESAARRSDRRRAT
jgi:peroxiredoxin